MATHPADERKLAKILRASGLFAADELQQLLERLPQVGGPRLLGERVRDGRLTTWQARRLLAGHSHFQIGHYRLEDQLDQSSAHVVFQARHTDHPAVMRLVQVSAKADIEGCRREFQRLTALRIPGIVPLVDVHRTSRCWYLAYAGPKSSGGMATAFSRTLPTSGLELRHVGRLASAVAQAHRQGVADGHLHRDRVVWLDDQPVVLDFGLLAAIHRLANPAPAALPPTAPPLTPPPIAPPLTAEPDRGDATGAVPTDKTPTDKTPAVSPPLPALPAVNPSIPAMEGAWEDRQQDWRAVGQLVEQWLSESTDETNGAQHPDSATVIQLRQWADWLATADARELSDSGEVLRQLHQETNSAPLESGDGIVAGGALSRGSAAGHTTARSAETEDHTAEVAWSAPTPGEGTSPSRVHRQARAADWTTLVVTLGLALAVVSAVIGFAAFLLWRTGGSGSTVAQKSTPAAAAPSAPAPTEPAAAPPPLADATGPLNPPVPEGFAPLGGSTNPSSPGSSEPSLTGPDASAPNDGMTASSPLGPDMNGAGSTTSAAEPAPAAPTSPQPTNPEPTVPEPAGAVPASSSSESPAPAVTEGPAEATGGEFETELDVWPPAEKNRALRTGLKFGRLEPPSATCRLEWESVSDNRRVGTWQLSSDGPRAWWLKWQDEDQGEQPGLRLEFNDAGELTGSWQQSEIPTALGGVIANSWLVVHFGDQTRRIQLRKAVRTPSVTLDLQSAHDRRRFELVPPAPENLKFEIIDLGGLMADAQPLTETTTGRSGKGVQPVRYVLREGSAMRMQVSAEVSLGRRIQVQIVPALILPGAGALVPYSEAGLAKLAAEINQSYLAKQKLNADKAAIDRVPKLSRLPEPRKQAMRASYDQQVKVLDEYESAVRATGSFGERVRQAGTLGYRIYAEGPNGAQLELIRTDSPVP